MTSSKCRKILDSECGKWPKHTKYVQDGYGRRLEFLKMLKVAGLATVLFSYHFHALFFKVGA